MKYIHSVSYVLTHQLKSATWYKWSKCGKGFNMRTGKEVKKLLHGRSIGYRIQGKFYSINTLRKQLEPIPKEKFMPF